MLRDGRWQPFPVPADHPASDAFHRLALLTDAANYADQQVALQQRSGNDIFVASLMVAEDELGSLATFCTWTKGVPSLLPRAEHIASVSPGETDADAEVLQVP